MTPPFRTRHILRFAHCDPAGIAYYPRYFELCDAAIEDWNEQVIGVSRRALHLDLGMATPTVSLAAEFVAASRLGDLLDFQLDVLKIGRSSIDMKIAVTCAGEPRFAIETRLVLVGGDPMRPVPWPDEWRERIETGKRPALV